MKRTYTSMIQAFDATGDELVIKTDKFTVIVDDDDDLRFSTLSEITMTLEFAEPTPSGETDDENARS